MSPQIIVALSVAISVTCLLLGLFYSWRDSQAPTADDRLTTVVNREFGGPSTTPAIQQQPNQGLLSLIAPRLSQSLKPKTGIEQEKLKLKLARAGFNGSHSAELYLCFKMICLIAGGFVGSIVGAAVWGAHQSALVCTGLSACLAFYLPEIILRSLTKKRQEEILMALPNAIDLLIVAIEVGQGLDAAIRRVTKELERNSRALSQEFSLYNLQLQMGRARSEALHDLGMRSGVADMNSFATVLIQADRFGVSIAKTMRQLSESARRKRRQRAEERAQKTAVKMLFPLVLFIFPGIFVVLVGPAMLLLWRDLSSMN
jgi:tight adherence protein C